MCVEMRIYMITGTIKKNWKMLITVLAAVIGVLAVYQPENAAVSYTHLTLPTTSRV